MLQIVIDRSASLFRGSYRQPPASFWHSQVRFAELLADGGIQVGPIAHAVVFTEEQRAKAVAVHVVLAEVGLRNVADVGDARAHELRTAIDVLAERPLAWRAAAAHHGQTRQAAHRDSTRISTVAESAAITARADLPFGEPGQTAINGPLGFGCQRFAGSFSRCFLGPRPARRNKRNRRSTGSGEKSSASLKLRFGKHGLAPCKSAERCTLRIIA